MTFAEPLVVLLFISAVSVQCKADHKKSHLSIRERTYHALPTQLSKEITLPNNAGSVRSIPAFHSLEVGGHGGSRFSDGHKVSSGSVTIRGIRIRSGRVIDAIEVIYSTGSGGWHGGRGGTFHSFDLDHGEHISTIFGSAGRAVDSLTFITDRRRVFGPFGGSGGTRFTFPLSGRLVYIFGGSGSRLDRIGFAHL